MRWHSNAISCSMRSPSTVAAELGHAFGQAVADSSLHFRQAHAYLGNERDQLIAAFAHQLLQARALAGTHLLEVRQRGGKQAASGSKLRFGIRG